MTHCMNFLFLCVLQTVCPLLLNLCDVISLSISSDYIDSSSLRQLTSHIMIFLSFVLVDDQMWHW